MRCYNIVCARRASGIGLEPEDAFRRTDPANLRLPIRYTSKQYNIIVSSYWSSSFGVSFVNDATIPGLHSDIVVSYSKFKFEFGTAPRASRSTTRRNREKGRNLQGCRDFG